MPKNIVVFSDGTGQEGGKPKADGKANNTNVYKLFNMIEDRTPDQVGYYSRGLGTGVHRITGNIAGVGISRNIRQCYRFLFDEFEAGDRIFLFGFSRGAATVRSLSNFIHHFGILPKSRPELIDRAYRIYRFSSPGKLRERAQSFIARHHTMWTRVHFLGCFDTVAALGLPNKSLSALLDGLPLFRHKFHDFRLSDSVDHARHALAIDDERKEFHPVLWDPLDDEPEDPRRERSLEQVWFCGMHTDVGGGYREQELSDVVLQWMTDHAVALGLRIYGQHRVPIEADVNGTMHDSRSGRIGRFFTKLVREWPEKRSDVPVLHPSVLERTLGTRNRADPAYAPWIKGLPFEVADIDPDMRERWAPADEVRPAARVTGEPAAAPDAGAEQPRPAPR